MSRPILVTRTFDVPAERLFEALDDNATMGRWLGVRIDLIKSPPDKGVGTVRRLNIGLQKIDEEIFEREVPRRIVYGIVRGLFPLSYHRGEINVTSLGPERSSVEWKIVLESKIPGLGMLVRAGLGRGIERGLKKLSRQLGGEAPSTRAPPGGSRSPRRDTHRRRKLPPQSGVRSRCRPEGHMAQQESSVRVSIEELLREAHAREAQEKRDAEERTRAAEQRRLDELRRSRQAEEARGRAEDAERARRAFDEEKRRVELRALHEGTVARAVTEAEVRARLAEMTARQEHERSLHALRHDRHKKRLARIAIALTVFAVAGGVAAGVAIKRSRDDAAAADAQLRGVRDAKDRLEQEQARLKQAIGNASDPDEHARLQQQLADAQRQLRSITAPATRAAPARTPAAAFTRPSTQAPATKPSDTCPRGDPLCATIP